MGQDIPDRPGAGADILPALVVETLHVATGALLGIGIRSPQRAFALGLLLHHVFDRIPHRDIPDEHFEALSGAAAMISVIGAHGFRHPSTAGALGSAVPDLEHVFCYLGIQRRRLFPAHRGRHPTGGSPTWIQLLTAGVLLGFVLSHRKLDD